MEPWSTKSDSSEELVEAIEEGRIVRVREQYARLEGLPILRKHKPTVQESIKTREKMLQDKQETFSFDDFRKPLRTSKSQVLSELLDNFHWEISKKRRTINLTRKQLAKEINEPESSIKLIENGILPSNDFVIINKLQSRLKINLRKDKQDFSQSPRSLIEKPNEKPEENNKKTQSPGQSASQTQAQTENSLAEDEIEIIDE